MTIRCAAASDAHDIARVHVSSWQEAYKGIVPSTYLDSLSVAERVTRWAEIFERGGSDTFVADESGAIIGFSTYGATRDDDARAGVGEVYAIYVAPSRWSTGVGYALWEQSRQGLADLGYSRATLWVLTANARAIRFYERAGFTLDANSETIIDIGGQSFPEVRYEVAAA